MKLALLFCPPPKPPKEDAAKAQDLAVNIVRRLARGNLSLQRGRFMTAEDLRKRFAKVL